VQSSETASAKGLIRCLFFICTSPRNILYWGGRNRELWAISLKFGKKCQSLLLQVYYSLLRILFEYRLPRSKPRAAR
jgi:hypothetical protein